MSPILPLTPTSSAPSNYGNCGLSLFVSYTFVAFTDNVLGTLSSSTPHQASSSHKATDIYRLPCPVALLWHSWREERSSSRQECHRLPCLSQSSLIFHEVHQFFCFLYAFSQFPELGDYHFWKILSRFIVLFWGVGLGRRVRFYLSLFYPSQKFCLHKHFLILLTPSDKLLSRKKLYRFVFLSVVWECQLPIIFQDWIIALNNSIIIYRWNLTILQV